MFFKKTITYSEQNLQEAIEASIQNDSRAQEFIYKFHYSFGKSVSLRYCNNAEEAEEILQDSYIKAFNNLIRYDISKPFKAWFRTIIMNTAIDYYRKGQKESMVISLEPYHEGPIEENVIDSFASDDLLEMVQKLTPAYRTVLMMYAVDGFSHKEIAEQLNISEGTSKSNLARARQNLQQMLLERDKEESLKKKVI